MFLPNEETVCIAGVRRLYFPRRASRDRAIASDPQDEKRDGDGASPRAGTVHPGPGLRPSGGTDAAKRVDRGIERREKKSPWPSAANWGRAE
jgi:hypothetical protein